MKLEFRDTDKDVEILEGDIAAITEEPKMPALRARLIGGSPDFNVEWRLTTRYQTPGNLPDISPRNDVCEFPESGPKVLAGDKPWVIANDWGDQFCGGDATLSYKVADKPARTLQFEIQGENPEAQSTVRNFLGRLRVQLIAHQESRFQQFQTLSGFVSSYEVGPFSVLRSVDEGYGLGQLTNTPIPSSQELWNWKLNALAIIDRAITALNDTLAYRNQVVNGLPWDGQTGGTPETPAEGVAAPDASPFTFDQIDMEVWARYNGGFRYHNWDPEEGQWVERPNNPAPGQSTGNDYAELLAPRRDAIV